MDPFLIESIQAETGKIMCCLCFDLLAKTDLHVIGTQPDGTPLYEDVCKPCAASETEQITTREG